MKYFSLLIAVIFMTVIFAPVSFANELQDKAIFAIQDEEFQTLLNNGDFDAALVTWRRGTSCYAWTRCANGSTISCQVYGSSQTRCLWQVIPGVRVDCKGFDDYGYWQHFWSRCW